VTKRHRLIGQGMVWRSRSLGLATLMLLKHLGSRRPLPLRLCMPVLALTRSQEMSKRPDTSLRDRSWAARYTPLPPALNLQAHDKHSHLWSFTEVLQCLRAVLTELTLGGSVCAVTTQPCMNG
jgi:hypothetical protein